MSPSRRSGASDARATGKQSASGEELFEVYLRRSVRPSGASRFYGPGKDMVPRSLYESLKLSPDLVETDAAGNPLSHTVAASVFGPATASGVVQDAHPTIPRDEDGDAVALDDDEADARTRGGSAYAARAAEIAEQAENGPDRQGGQLAGESGSLEAERDAFPLPGQTEHSREQQAQLDADQARDASNARAARSAGGASASRSAGSAGDGDEGKAATKSELRALDRDVLDDLARKNGVKVPAGASKKVVVDRLYNARVTV